MARHFSCHSRELAEVARHSLASVLQKWDGRSKRLLYPWSLGVEVREPPRRGHARPRYAVVVLANDKDDACEFVAACDFEWDRVPLTFRVGLPEAKSEGVAA